MPTRSRFTQGRSGRALRLCCAACLLAANAGGHAGGGDRVWRDDASGIEFVRIDGACFDQGAARAGERDEGAPIPLPREDEVPQRRVCLDGFWLGRTEVTRGQWARLLAPGSAPAEPDRPQADVSWHDAQRFVDALNRIAGSANRLFRLPTEAEWEYACHAGNYRPARQLHGQDRYEWMQETAREALYQHPTARNPRTSAVARREANAWGLFDMLGNVWEWTADRYDAQAYRHGARDRIAGRDVPGERVLRGGSFMSNIAQVRCGARNAYPAGDGLPVIGLRMAMEQK